MRRVSGLDRPVAQWALVATCIVLTVLLALATRNVQRTTDQVEGLRSAERDSMAESQSLEAELARERAAREALSLELARLRARQGPESDSSASETPTVTLVPPANRGALPPDPVVAAPDRDQVIELRLLLPDGMRGKQKDFQIVARDWSTGQIRWSRAGATIETVDGRRAIVLHITGEMLAPGTYELLLNATTDEASTPQPVASYEMGVRPRESR